MIRYLILTRTTQQAGAEKIIKTLEKGLQDSGSRVTVATLSQVASWQGARDLFRTLFLDQFDVLHSHLFLPGVVARAIQSKPFRFLVSGQRVWIHTVHYGSYEGQSWPRVKRFVDRHFVFPKSDRLVAVSHSVASWLKMAGFSRASVLTIQNSLSPQVSTPSIARSTNSIDNNSTIVSVSMLRREKGITHLLSAFALLKARRPNVRLRIAGEGPERRQLELQISKSGLSDSVELVGYVDDFESFLASGQVFALPSLIESFGLSALEAIRVGLPVVASDAGELPAMLNHGEFGTIVSHGERFHERFAVALEDMLLDLESGRAKAAAGRQFHQRLFASERMIADYSAEAERLLRPAVCMVSPIITHATGGIQKQIWLQSNELSRRGYRVYLLQKNDPALAKVISSWPHVEFLQTPRLPDALHAKSNFVARLDGLFFIFFGTFKVWQIRHRLRIIHAHQLYSPSIVGWLAKTLLKIPFVVKVTASGAFGEMNELRKLPFWTLRKMAFKDIDRVIVLSDQMKEEMRELGFQDDRISLIPNSVETPSQHLKPTLSSESAAANQTLKILFTGRLSKEKSLETLIEAGQKLAADGIKIQIDLVGGIYGGRDSSELLKRMASQPTENLKVFFHPPQADISEFYKQADVFVLPSLSEGMSNALLEAMAYSLPCVVSEIGANTFVVTDEMDGLTFKTSDAGDLARQLKRLIHGQPDADRLVALSDADRLVALSDGDRLVALSDGLRLRAQLGAAARQTVERRFSVVSIGQRLTDLYQEVRTK